MNLPKGFESGKGKDKLTITVKLTETEFVESFLKEYNSILKDERPYRAYFYAINR